MRLLATGRQVKDAQLTNRKAGESPLDYIVIEFRPVIVTSISTGGSGGEDRLTENVTFNFGEFNYKYTRQRPDGAADGGPLEFGWDISRNTAL